MFNLRGLGKSPVASTNPSCQSKSLGRMRKRFWSHLGAEPGWSNSHSNPLNRPYNTTHVLASHSSNTVAHVVLICKLEGNSQDRPKIVTICICFTSWTSTTRTYFKSRGQIQCASSSRSILLNSARQWNIIIHTWTSNTWFLNSIRKFYTKNIAKKIYWTGFGSNGMTRKPDGNNGASSAKDSSIGANTSWAQAPTAFSSTPLHSCRNRFQEKSC